MNNESDESSGSANQRSLDGPFKPATLANQTLGFSCGGRGVLHTPENAQEKLVRLNLETGDIWVIVEEDGISKLKLVKEFSNFKEAEAWAKGVGQVAEKWGHHPEIRYTWGKGIILFHSIKMEGLTKDDFIMAARTSLFLSD